MELKPDLITIDMVDIILEINSFDFESKFKPIIEARKFDNRLEYKENFTWDRYRHNWNWKNEEETYSFYFAYQGNLESIKDRFYFSYNPNKVDSDDGLFIEIMTFILTNINKAQISKFDVAFDYEGIRTTDLIIDKSSYKEHKTFRYPDSDPTEYLGKGVVKIYDKASEEVKENPDSKIGNKTRIEYTIRDKIPFLGYEGYQCKATMGNFNLKGVLGLYDDDDLSPKEKFLVYSIENGYPIEKISWKDKNRYKEISENKKEVYTEIKPTQSQVEKALKEYLSCLLVSYNYTTKLKEAQIEAFIDKNKISNF